MVVVSKVNLAKFFVCITNLHIHTLRVNKISLNKERLIKV